MYFQLFNNLNYTRQLTFQLLYTFIGAKRKTTNSEQKANGGLSDKLTSYFEPANSDKRTRRQKKWFDEHAE